MFKTFAAFVYVTETEHQAVMRMYDWKENRFEGDGQLYYEASFMRDGSEYRVVAARQGEMGMTAAATMSMKIIYQYRPQYIIMPGIAAGAGTESSEDQLFGDVVLADTVWNYANGKYVPADRADIRFGTVGFIPRPTTVSLAPELMPYMKAAIESPKNECHVHFGPLASGTAVVANSEIINKQIRTQFQNTKGLEMEGYGVVYAAKEATEPRPYAIVAKSICDFADSRKNDNYQRFAAYTSCEFVKLLCEEFLPDRVSDDLK